MENVSKLVTSVKFMTLEETVWAVFQPTFFPRESVFNHNLQTHVQLDNIWVMITSVMEPVISVRFTAEPVDNAANVSTDISLCTLDNVFYRKLANQDKSLSTTIVTMSVPHVVTTTEQQESA